MVLFFLSGGYTIRLDKVANVPINAIPNVRVDETINQKVNCGMLRNASTTMGVCSALFRRSKVAKQF